MSANKFKVGNKVKVRKGLIANKYYGAVRCDSSMTKMSGRVLVVDCIRIDGCYLLSSGEQYIIAGGWYTAEQLEKSGYVTVEPEAVELTIEIDGKKYKKADVEKAIKDLGVVE